MKSIGSLLINFAAALAIGVVFIIWPGKVVSSLVIIIALLLVIAGIAAITGYFIKKKKGINGLIFGFPFAGIISIILGIVMIANPVYVSKIFIILMGVILLLIGFSQLFLIFRSRMPFKIHPFLYISTLFIFISGILAVFNPVQLANIVLIFIGISCIAYALNSVITWKKLKNYRRGMHIPEDDANIVDADIIDETKNK